MSLKDRLTAFGEQARFTVSVESDVVRAVRVPCLLADGVVGTCTIEKSFDPASSKPNDRIPGATEDELRRDAWKWENCLHAEIRKRGSSLQSPCFDIHYNARLEGRNFSPAEKLKYAMVVTVQAKSAVDLYNQVVRQYSTQIEPLRPILEIPVRA